ncbi:cilia- and flagella-associated protein 36 [Latimeria chalumnae]|uniref:Cilia- and flagella-associated protein 36 n=1 Tax=Latimeria chalumnae TaxID=7897 RepID=H3AWG5_LATCH|nr:PREDICTED: cilia- and flagella-associated protein 36 [Latimeria chalumnae]|eukprot:XP_006004970.1 PREDICTED: cilia- and flagella-associated protein 36 [Latimeria chalumnae]
MAEEAEWVVESIVGFLTGPVWTGPVTEFIEQKCTVFDDDEENKLSYTEIHQQYKELVEKLLEDYLQEIGIQEEQFQRACTSPFAQSHTLQPIFQPVLAAEDFEVFKTLMVQKNVELQLQALQMLRENNGVLPDCLTDGADALTELEQQEIRILKEVLKKSKEEYDKEINRRSTAETGAATTSISSIEEKILEKAEEEEMQFGPEHQKGVESLQKEVDKLVTESEFETEDSLVDSREAGKNLCKVSSQSPTKLLPGRGSRSSNKALGPVRTPIIGAEPLTELKKVNSSEAAEAWLEEARKEAGISGPMTELTEAEKKQLRQRAEYLKQQRDKLMALKKEPRNKLTQDPENQKPKESETCEEVTEEHKKILQKRKQLAEKLKQEVIKK